jgi:hypothetical protein
MSAKKLLIIFARESLVATHEKLIYRKDKMTRPVVILVCRGR